MKRRGNPLGTHIPAVEPAESLDADQAEELEKLIGLGERSIRKSYYPELRRKIGELERFQVLVDTARDFIYLVRLDPLSIVHANYAAMECFGVGATFEGRNVVELFGVKMADRLLAFFRHPGRSRHATFQTELPRYRNPALPVEISVSLHELDGVEYAVIVARDISERLRAEQELDASAQRISAMASELEFLLSNMGDCLYRRGIDGKLRYVSPSITHVTGYTPEEFIEGGGSYRTDNPMNKSLEDSIARILSGEDVPPFHVEFRHKDGRIGVLEVLERPFFEDGKVAGGIGVARDVTERVRATEESRRLRALLANTINAMPSILVGVDTEGKVMQWNRQAEMDSGVSSHDALGKPLTEIYPRLSALDAEVKASMDSLTPIALPRRQYFRDGRMCFESVTIFPLPREEEHIPVGVVIRIDDVTEQVRLEQIMIQTEKMMSVGGLAAGMAHEINNPLGGILQGAQNILRRLSPDLPANRQAADDVGCSLDSIQAYIEERKILKMLEGIRESAVRAAEIVQNMLSFARKSDSSQSTYQLNDIVENTVRLASTDYDLKKSFDFRHIEIVREFAGDLPLITCSRTEIEQVLLNLLRNAAQAMVHMESPVITLRTRLEAPRRSKTDMSYLTIVVEDNGPGMDEQTRMRIFEPFFTTKEPGVGTGLGLSVSYFIITENHKGQMEVESVPGKGTRFTIRLPFEGPSA
ncbi:PAS domain S-box protein [Desulfovibrio mangrovi]|uniref:PAS domain-containing sensor histidine kinase n=1 Tax=Desulfovibrio mangrovi TaxID=2976983 RepID=UPI0022483531|nr:PAS domain-containing sensor histidine kinase [Desulfovibrio mangrovi]UZP67357.1 PAS domain S-box protein [Desulfovibrio mangrovi]